MADIAMLLAEEYEKMMKKKSQEIEVFRKIEDGYSWIKVRFQGDYQSDNKVLGLNPKSQIAVAAVSGFFSAWDSSSFSFFSFHVYVHVYVYC